MFTLASATHAQTDTTQLVTGVVQVSGLVVTGDSLMPIPYSLFTELEMREEP